MQFFGGLATAFGLGFLYFIGAIPAAAALGLPLWAAAIAAWLGYSAGGALVVFAGTELRIWLERKFRFERSPSRPSFIKRMGDRFGLPAVGLLAPVTIGPQIAGLMGVALGVPRIPLLLAISLGAIPWAAIFAVAIHFGFKLTTR